MDAHDRLEIHELITRYCHILDTRNWADLNKIFLPDSVVDSGPTLGGLPRAAGDRGLLERLPATPDGHHALNVLIEGEEPRRDGAGCYEGVLRAAWRFQRRRLSRRRAQDRGRAGASSAVPTCLAGRSIAGHDAATVDTSQT